MMSLYGHDISMALGMVLFWVLAVGAAVWLLGAMFPAYATKEKKESQVGAARPSSALEIVRLRYAAGEITRAEFEELSREVQG